MKKRLPTLAAMSCAVLAFSLPSIALSKSSGQHLFVCTDGGFVERSTERKERAPLSVSITFDFNDNSSEVLIGSRSNLIIGQRDPIYLDGLAREDNATITGYMLGETDTSEYWTLRADEKTALVSLDDIVVLAENCTEIGAGSPNQGQSETAPNRAADANLDGAVAARHFEALMSAQDRLLELPGDIPKYAVISASGLLSSKISEWAPSAIESGRIDQRELFYLMAISTNYLANLAAEAGLQAATACHLQESQALTAASQGATPERVGCRRAAYREIIAHALRNSAQLSEPDIEDSVNRWATNALLLGLDSVEMDLR